MSSITPRAKGTQERCSTPGGMSSPDAGHAQHGQACSPAARQGLTSQGKCCALAPGWCGRGCRGRGRTWLPQRSRRPLCCPGSRGPGCGPQRCLQRKEGQAARTVELPEQQEAGQAPGWLRLIKGRAASFSGANAATAQAQLARSSSRSGANSHPQRCRSPAPWTAGSAAQHKHVCA